MPMPDLDIRGSGSGWAIYDGPLRISRIYANGCVAITGLRGIERRRRLAAARPRACLCCGTTFPSEGPHNRLCQPCKAFWS
jgi:hypothetical protein